MSGDAVAFTAACRLAMSSAADIPFPATSAMQTAALPPPRAKVKAAVAFYGYPQGDTEPDWSKLDASVHGHMAENDDFFGPEGAKALEAKLRDMDKDVTITVHPGTGHAFMGPHNALGTLDEDLANELWPQVTAFLHDKLG